MSRLDQRLRERLEADPSIQRLLAGLERDRVERLAGLVLMLGIALAGCSKPSPQDTEAAARFAVDAIELCESLDGKVWSYDVTPHGTGKAFGSVNCAFDGAEQTGPRSHSYGRLPAESTADPGGG